MRRSQDDKNKRGEIKLTGTVAQNHTIQGGYLNNPRTRTNNSGRPALIIDPHASLDHANPNWYYFTNYRGGLGEQACCVEAQYSERRFEFKGDGGTQHEHRRFAVLLGRHAASSTTRRTSMRPIRSSATTGS